MLRNSLCESSCFSCSPQRKKYKYGQKQKSLFNAEKAFGIYKLIAFTNRDTSQTKEG